MLMRNKITLLLVCLLLSCLLEAQEQDASIKLIYVSPSGNNANPGSVEQPLRSFEGAQKMVQKFRNSQAHIPVRVVFRGGKYYRTKPVVFTAIDGGTEQAPVVYTAYPGEQPKILGGKRLQLNWKVHKNGVFKAEIPRGLEFESLFVNDQAQILARYPNYDSSQRIFNGTSADCLSAERVQNWKDPAGGYFHVIHKAMWGGFHYKILGKDKKGELIMEGGWQNNRPENGLHDKLRYVENIYEELDSEKEWYLDKEKSVLYFKPDRNTDLNTAVIEVAYLENFVSLRGTEEEPVKYLSIEGFHFNRSIRTFMKTKDRLLRSDWAIYRGGAILLEGTENCQIKDSEFDQIGSNGIFFNGYNRYSKVEGCHLYDIGGSAICFVGDTSAVRNAKFVPYGRPVMDDELDLTPGPKNNKYPAYCTVENNLLHDFGKVEKQTAGVQISIASHITVRNNSIYDCPRSGINIGEGAFGGHLIAFNDIFNTVLETSDHGSFNSWGRDRFWMANNKRTEKRTEANRATILLDILAPTVIRNNRMKCDHGWDIDLDDGSSLYEVSSNLCLTNGIKLREGYFRTVRNNITLNNSLHPHVWFKNSGDVVTENIFGTKMFPIRVDYWGSEVDRNWYINESDLLTMQELGIEQESQSGDPLFVSAETGDFRVAANSPVLDLGWKNFDMEHFGVQKANLKKIAKQPEIPSLILIEDKSGQSFEFFGGLIKSLETQGEVSATGMDQAKGVLILKEPIFGSVVDFGLKKGDVILKLNDQEIFQAESLVEKDSLFDKNQVTRLSVWRDQKLIKLNL